MRTGLTGQQEKVYGLIRNYIDEFALGPTLFELMNALSIKTKRGILKHLDALESKGYIFRTGKPRGIYLSESEMREIMDIEILGYANAGKPLVNAEEQRLGKLHVDKKILKHAESSFALIVQGDSMNKAMVNGVAIQDGDYIIVENTQNVQDGDIVLAVVNNAATVKILKKGVNSLILLPKSSNPVHKPIYLDNGSNTYINGKVIAALENPRI
jgi:repressor LexA